MLVEVSISWPFKGEFSMASFTRRIPDSNFDRGGLPARLELKD